MSTDRVTEQPPRMTTAFIVVGVVGLSGLLGAHAWGWLGSLSESSSLIRNAVFMFASAALGTVAWERRGALYRLLISVPFAVAILTVLMLSTALGTVVLQAGQPAEYAHRYGSLAPVLLWLGVDDVFRAAWFYGLLGLLTVSVVLVGTRRAVWRLAMLGHMLSHLGIAVILIGGLLGALFGERGMIDIHEGEIARSVVLTDRGVPTGERLPLDFALRLDDFEIDRHEPDYRIRVYEEKGPGYRLVSSLRVEEAEAWTSVDGAGTELRALNLYTDFELKRELRSADTGGGGQALEVDLLLSDDVVELTLLAGVPNRTRVEVDEDGSVLGLVSEPLGEAELSELARSVPARHLVTVVTDDGVAGELEVVLGESRELAGGGSLRALAFEPDFVFDTATGAASSRSSEPLNPALRVAVRQAGSTVDEERWLFQNLPGYGDPHDEAHGGKVAGDRLVYHHEPALRPPPRETLVVGATREVWQFENGEVVARSPLEDFPRELPGVSMTGYQLLDGVIEVERPTSRSDAWSNPVLELELRRDGNTSRELLAAAYSQPIRLPDGKHLLTFEPRSDDVKDYRSRLTVLEGDSVVTSKTIEVNDPLWHNGYVFYQSNYRAEDPTYSGILVVKDPGFPVVLLGFVMISIGVIFIYYVRPRIYRWRV